MGEFLSLRQVAQVLHVDRTTVWRWCKEGKLPAYRIGGFWQVRRSELERWVRRRYPERSP